MKEIKKSHISFSWIKLIGNVFGSVVLILCLVAIGLFAAMRYYVSSIGGAITVMGFKELQSEVVYFDDGSSIVYQVGKGSTAELRANWKDSTRFQLIEGGRKDDYSHSKADLKWWNPPLNPDFFFVVSDETSLPSYPLTTPPTLPTKTSIVASGNSDRIYCERKTEILGLAPAIASQQRDPSPVPFAVWSRLITAKKDD